MNANREYKFPPITLLEANDSTQVKLGSIIRLRALVDTETFRKVAEPLTVPIGVDAVGDPFFYDIAKWPHLIIAGATGTGKGMWLQSAITSLICKNTPDEVKLILIDPKWLEFEYYNNLPHLAIPIAKGALAGIDSLNWAVGEMERRLKLPNKEALPNIVIIVDELADLMMTASDKVEELICRLAQMGQKVGIHLIIATQRPRPDVITELIKANILSRIAFAVFAEADSRCILNTVGAEKLNEIGKMIFAPAGAKSIRLQSPCVSGEETERIVTFIKEHNGEKAE